MSRPKRSPGSPPTNGKSTSGKFSPDGKHLTWTANTDGQQDIYVYDVATRQAHACPWPKASTPWPELKPPLAMMDHACSITTAAPTAPNDLWAYDFAAQKSHQVTHSLVGGIRSEDMVEPFLVHYPSKDGKWQISAFVYVPYNAEKNGKNAAMVLIHGGPTESISKFLRAKYPISGQPGLLRHCPKLSRLNRIRKEFEDANRLDMGGGDLEDVISLPIGSRRPATLIQKSRRVRGQLWRLPHNDGRDQSARSLGCGCADCSFRQLVY